MVEGNKCPVGHDTCDPLAAFKVLTNDKVFHSGCIHENDVWHGEHLRQQGGCEEGSMLDDNEGALVFVRDPDLLKEAVGRFANHLGRVTGQGIQDRCQDEGVFAPWVS